MKRKANQELFDSLYCEELNTSESVSEPHQHSSTDDNNNNEIHKGEMYANIRFLSPNKRLKSDVLENEKGDNTTVNDDFQKKYICNSESFDLSDDHKVYVEFTSSLQIDIKKIIPVSAYCATIDERVEKYDTTTSISNFCNYFQNDLTQHVMFQSNKTKKWLFIFLVNLCLYGDIPESDGFTFASVMSKEIRDPFNMKGSYRGISDLVTGKCNHDQLYDMIRIVWYTKLVCRINEFNTALRSVMDQDKVKHKLLKEFDTIKKLILDQRLDTFSYIVDGEHKFDQFDGINLKQVVSIDDSNLGKTEKLDFIQFMCFAYIMKKSDLISIYIRNEVELTLFREICCIVSGFLKGLSFDQIATHNVLKKPHENINYDDYLVSDENRSLPRSHFIKRIKKNDGGYIYNILSRNTKSNQGNDSRRDEEINSTYINTIQTHNTEDTTSGIYLEHVVLDQSTLKFDIKNNGDDDSGHVNATMPDEQDGILTHDNHQDDIDLANILNDDYETKDKDNNEDDQIKTDTGLPKNDLGLVKKNKGSGSSKKSATSKSSNKSSSLASSSHPDDTKPSTIIDKPNTKKGKPSGGISVTSSSDPQITKQQAGPKKKRVIKEDITD